MKILHIAQITNNLTNGVNAVVPQHIKYQSAFADIKFVNLNKIFIDGLHEWQFEFNQIEDILKDFDKQNFVPNLVIIHEVNNISNIKLGKILRKAKIPYLIVPHGELVKLALRKKWIKKKIAYILLFNKFIRKAIAIQCLSQVELENIKIKTPKKFVSTNGVTLPDKYKTSFNSDKCNMVYIGRLEWKVKGLDMLFEAMSLIKDFMFQNNVKIDIYGPDIYNRKAEVEQLIMQNNVKDFINIYEPVFGDEKELVLVNSDIFIQTSRHEGMPCGILEALSYGLPCIITEGTNLVSDVIAFDAGYNAGNTIESIADAIKTAVVDSKNWSIKGQNAINLIKQKYEWEMIAQDAINRYKELGE